jgi:hypothetical protein
MEQENKPIRFALARINTDQFAIMDSAYQKEHEVKMNIGLRFGSDKEIRFIQVKTLVKFEQANAPFLLIEASCFFNIEPTDWDSMMDNETLIVPKGLITHLTMLTVGTVRGILHAKTEGTNFNGFVLPTINVTELIKEDIRL